MTDKKMESAYVPETELEKLIYRGDQPGVVQFFARLAPADFAQHRKVVFRMEKPLENARFAADPSAVAWRGRVTEQQRQALYTANFICGSVEEKITGCWGFWNDDSTLLALWRAFPPDHAQPLVEAMLAKSVINFGVARSLFLAGLVARPTHENYALGFLKLPLDSDTHLSVRRCLEQDPDWTHDALLEHFDVEGSTTDSLAHKDKYGTGLNSPRNSWAGLFMELCAQGVYSRELLIGKTLGTLEKDWIQFRSGWFSRFHDLLAPTVDEMAQFAPCYLGLCNSRIAPTVTLALAALDKLLQGGFVRGEDLMAALRPVLSSSVKSQVESALKLVDQVVTKDASLGAQACEAAMPAFAHSAADIHKRLITRLRAWGMSDAAGQLARDMLPLVSAANRDALAALLGEAPSTVLSGTSVQATALPTLQPPLSVLDASRKLLPIESVDVLVEQAAYVMENATDTDELERVIDALLRLHPFSADDKKRFSPVLKRARKLTVPREIWREHEKPVARELARLLVFLLDGERLAPPLSYAKGHINAHAFLCERVEDLMNLAAQGQSVSPLASPTHRRGVIDPALLIARVEQHLALGVTSILHEQVLSLLRLAPTTDPSVLAVAKTLRQTPYVLALRYALGDSVPVGTSKPLFVAAGRIRHPNAGDPDLIQAYGDLGPDGPHVAQYVFSTTASPGDGYTFHYGHVDTQPQPRMVEPDYFAVFRHPVWSRTGWGSTSISNFGGEDEGPIRLSATLLPSSLEAFFAEGVRNLSNNLDWSGAQWYNKAYLELLLDPTVPFTPMAYLALACGLAGKEPGQTAMAVDALVAAWVEGRLDATQLAAVLRNLVQTPLVKVARIAKTLSTAARAHAMAPHLAFSLVCEMVLLDAELPPKDTGALLELLLEVALQLAKPLPQATRAAIEKLKLGGKGKAAQKELLQRLC